MHRSISINACCPFEDCGKSLLDSSVMIAQKPAVHLIVEKDGVRGNIYLSSWYDDYKCVDPEEFNLLPGDIVKFSCPHCGRELPVAEKCACKAKRVWLGIEGDGKIRICCRKGCHYHSLEFDNTSKLTAIIAKSKDSNPAEK